MKRALLFAALCIAIALPASIARPALAAEGALDFTIAIDPAALLAAAPAPQPGEDGLVVYEAHHYRYAEGLMRHRHQRLLRVTTEWALERLADPRLRFDSARQKITVHAARTYLPGGGAVDSPSNAFNTVTPGELALAPDFLDIQELVITHIGLEPGCALWLDTEIVDTAPAGLPEGALLFPQGEFPVLAMDVTAEGLYAELINPEGGLLALPAGSSEGLRHSWHFEKLPAAPGQATYRRGEQLPHLNLSPLQAWEQVLVAVGEQLEAAIADTTGLGVWLAGIEHNLERPFLHDRDALCAWLSALTQRTTLLDGQECAWRSPRSVARVLESSLATPLERAALIEAASRTRDLHASLLLMRHWSRRSEQLLPLAAVRAPMLDYPHLLVDAAEGRLLAAGESNPLDAHWLFPPDATRMRPGSPPLIRADTSQYWDLNNGKYTLSLAFSLDRLWQGIATPESALRNWVATWTDSSEVTSLSFRRITGEHIVADISAKVPLPEVGKDGVLRLALPVLPVDLTALVPQGMQRAQSICRAILFVEYWGELHLSWTLELPADMDVVTMPGVSASCYGASFTLSRKRAGQRLEIRYDLESRQNLRISPADYPAFRELVNAALDPKTTEVLLVPRAKD